MKADRGALTAALRRLDPKIRLVLLHGPDDSASRDLALGFAAQFADAADPIGATVLPGNTLAADPGALLAAASAVSMFGGTTLVRVEGAGEDALAAVDALLSAPAAGNPVVMTAGALKKGSKLLARVEGDPAALSHISYLPDARSGGASVGEIAAELGLRPTRAATMALVDATGGDRGLLRRELEKIALYLDATVAAPQPLDIDAVAAIGAGVGDADFGALIDGIAGGQPEVADRQIARFAADGIPGITLLRTVCRRFWQLLDLRLAVDGGSSAASAVAAARPPVFWKEKDALTAQVALWRTPAIRSVLARLLAAERAVKRSGSAGDVAVNQLLLGIASQGARR